jgi:hypothetical protein
LRSSLRSGSVRFTKRADSCSNRVVTESGDTLIEILISITVLGLVGLALLGGFGTSISASAEYRNLAAVDSVLKNFAESATNQIQLQTSPIFSPCATITGKATNTSSNLAYVTATHTSTPLTFTPPAGYTVQITQEKYLFNNTTFDQNVSPTTCDTSQFWPQLFTATATGPKGVNENLAFVVEDPGYETYVPPTTTVTTTSTTTTTTTTTTTIPTTTTTIPTTTTTVLAPTITFPTTANPYYAGHNAGTESLIITGTNLLSATVTVTPPFTLNSIVSDTATSITITLTGSGGANQAGTLTVTIPDGSSATYSGDLINGGTYNGQL